MDERTEGMFVQRFPDQGTGQKQKRYPFPKKSVEPYLDANKICGV